MAELRLNKPLYKDDPPAGTTPAERPAARTRPPRAGMMSRIAAMGVDILFLHAISSVVLLMVHREIVSLGVGGAIAGLIVGLGYFAFSAARPSGGRSLGKMIMRLRVADIAGPPLPASQAVMRAVLMGWPLLLYMGLHVLGETAARTGVEAILPGPYIFGVAIAAGWYSGNIFYAMAEPHGRTLVDRLAGSAIVASDSPAAEQAEWLRSIREEQESGASRRAMIFLIVTMAGIIALTGFQVHSAKKQVRNLTPEERGKLERLVQATTLPGYRFSMDTASRPSSADSATAPDDANTSEARYAMMRRGRIDLDELRGDPAVNTMPDRLGAVMKDQWAAEMEKNPTRPIPLKLRVRVAFAEVGDLFWARRPLEVYALSVVVDFSDLQTQAQDTTATATAAGDAATTTSDAATTATDEVTTAPEAPPEDSATTPAI